MKIYRLNSSSIDRIIFFDELCFPSDHWNVEDWKELINDDKSYYYAVENVDEIIASIFVYNWAGEKDYLKITSLSVHPDYRGKGYGNKLLEFIKVQMNLWDIHKASGETRASNHQMQKLFEKSGFILSGKVQEYYKDPDEDAYKYVLLL